MLPLKLIIEGLYSYREAQTIDFSRLTDAGLFGIFGATGSGKSSILEAITFVLYGETERMNSRENRAYNMMNLASDRMFIEFDFLNYEYKTFRINREYKRSKKTFDNIITPVVSTYELTDGNWIPIDKTAEEILGISYDNFKRTIIIPQGQFKEFLDLKDTARTQMMKDIFHLERYDLQNKVQVLREKNQAQLNTLLGELNAYSQVTPEIIEAARKQLLEANQIQDATKKEFEAVQEKYNLLKKLKADFDDLKIKINDLNSKAAQESTYNQRQLRLETFEKVSRVLKPLFLEKKKLQENATNTEIELRKVSEKLDVLKSSLQTAEFKKQTLTQPFESLPTKKQELFDLKIIEKIIVNTLRLNEFSGRIEKGKDMVLQTETALKQVRQSIAESDKEIQNLQTQKLDTRLLIEIGEWYSKSKTLNQLHIQRNEEVQKIKKDIAKEQDNLKQRNIQKASWTDTFDKQAKQLQEQKNKLEEQKNALEVQQKLAHYADELQDGAPCPLCGSVHHPNISKQNHVTDALHDIKSQILTVDAALKTLENTKSEVSNIIQRLDMLEQQHLKEETQLSAILADILLHNEAFVWTEFDKTDTSRFDEKRQLSQHIETQTEQLQKSLRELRKQDDELSSNEKIYTDLLNNLTQEQSIIKSEIRTDESHLTILKMDDFKQYPKEAIQEKHINLESFILKTEHDFNAVTQQINDLKPDVAAQSTLLETLRNQLGQTANDIKNTKEDIQQQLIHLNIGSDEAETVISQEIDIDNERQAINQFRVALEVLKAEVTGIKTRLQDAAYDEATWLQAEKQYLELKEQLEQHNQHTTQLQGEIKRLETNYAQKIELTQAYEQIEHRSKNLQTLYNLFKGAGFIKYISSVYLRQLCQHANVRFRQMTHNSLVLDMNASDEFEIIDNLNQGRKRSIKTLSGGQAFQVSLSLALALAESVQSRSGTDRNFFFIDEGFGTQDNQSVNIVFETLLNLNKEKKVVGIISHVDELKERIPISITINNDHERGSIMGWS